MKPFLFLLLAAPLLRLASPNLQAAAPAVLTDDIYQIPPGEWRWVPFEIRRPAIAECRFETVAGEMRAELVSRTDLELIRAHKPHDSLTFTDTTRSGAFSRYVHESGEYAVVIENAGSRPAEVHLTVNLILGVSKPAVQYLSPNRRLTVIVVSFVMFFGIATFSARALLRAMKRA